MKMYANVRDSIRLGTALDQDWSLLRDWVETVGQDAANEHIEFILGLFEQSQKISDPRQRHLYGNIYTLALVALQEAIWRWAEQRIERDRTGPGAEGSDDADD